jgi:GT2 family glycosyltransferase
MRELSIIILQHNTPKFVEENLAALKTAELPKDTEVIIVNNGGNHANQKIDQNSYNGLNIKFFETPNDGFPAGNNFGLSQTKANYYAFVNPDIVVQPDTLKKLLDYMKQNPKVGIVSPQLIYADGSMQDNYRVFPRILDLIIKRIPFLRKIFTNRMRKYLMWDRDPHNNEAVDWVTGAFTLVSSDCMQAIKKHDDDHYFLFMSDVVLCREAYKQGFETHIVGSVKCLHNDERVSSGGLKDVFKKKIIRLHIKDAVCYFWHYKFEKLPPNSPSNTKKL